MIRILMKHNLTFLILTCFYLVLMGFAWTHSAHADDGRKSTIQEPVKETDEAAIFRQVCMQHRPSLWTGELRMGGSDTSMNCKSGDGGNVGISIVNNDGIITIHQTKQMDAGFIQSVLDALRVEMYLGDTTNIPDADSSATEKARYECANKLKKAQSSRKYGDMAFKFALGSYQVTCDGSK